MTTTPLPPRTLGEVLDQHDALVEVENVLNGCAFQPSAYAEVSSALHSIGRARKILRDAAAPRMNTPEMKLFSHKGLLYYWDYATSSPAQYRQPPAVDASTIAL